MAREITASASLTASKGGASVSASAAITNDMAGDQMLTNVQNIGTSAEALVLGDITTIGFLFVKNLDATNYVEVDSVNTLDEFPQKLLPGEFVLLKPQTTTIYAKANTAACNVLVQAVEL